MKTLLNSTVLCSALLYWFFGFSVSPLLSLCLKKNVEKTLERLENHFRKRFASLMSTWLLYSTLHCFTLLCFRLVCSPLPSLISDIYFHCLCFSRFERQNNNYKKKYVMNETGVLAKSTWFRIETFLIIHGHIWGRCLKLSASKRIPGECSFSVFLY